MKKYAFILMGDYDTKKDTAVFEKEDMKTYIMTVKSFKQAEDLVRKLKDDGFGAIETCGAFSIEEINKLKLILNGEVGIARVVADKDQEMLISNFFNK